MVNYNYTKEDLVDAIVAARMSYLPWAHILVQEIDKLAIDLAFRPKTEERQYTLAGLSENKENE